MFAARLGRGAGATTVVGVDVGADAEDLPVVDGAIIIRSGGLGRRGGGGGRGEHGWGGLGSNRAGGQGAGGRHGSNQHARRAAAAEANEWRQAGGVQKGVIAESRIKGESSVRGLIPVHAFATAAHKLTHQPVLRVQSCPALRRNRCPGVHRLRRFQHHCRPSDKAAMSEQNGHAWCGR